MPRIPITDITLGSKKRRRRQAEEVDDPTKKNIEVSEKTTIDQDYDLEYIDFYSLTQDDLKDPTKALEKAKKSEDALTPTTPKPTTTSTAGPDLSYEDLLGDDVNFYDLLGFGGGDDGGESAKEEEERKVKI